MEKFYAKLRLAMLGQAIGDSFGAPFEYHKRAPELAVQSIEEQRFLESPEGVPLKYCRMPGLYTDDTQQALALVHVRYVCESDPSHAPDYFRSLMGMMSRVQLPQVSFGSHRGTGRFFRSAIQTGKPPKTAGLGGCMRVGPVAVAFDDPQEMVEWVLAVTEVTTCDPVGLAVAAKFAAIVWAIAYPERRQEVREVVWPDTVPEDVWEATTEALRRVQAGGEEALLAYGRSTGWANKEMKCAANGFGLTGFAWVVHCALSASSFEDALIRVCSSGGDTDTVAAMAGCLAALKFGEDSIPDWMKDTVEGSFGINSPWEWDPKIEEDLTKMDISYRKKLATVQRNAQIRRQKEPEREVLDFFDLAEEAEEEEAQAQAPILFGGKGDDPTYKCFSNFTTAPFILEDEEWQTVEHYYQAMKSLDPEVREAIRMAPRPGKAKHMGRRVELRPDWEDVKREVMLEAVTAKFEQNPELLDVLLSTEDRRLHENRPDPVWGGGPNYPNGTDWLGEVLEIVRDIFREG